MTRGTLIVETRLSSVNRLQTLLCFERSHPWPGSFSLRALPGGSIVLIDAQGNDIKSTVLPCPYNDRTDIVRLSYSWDAPRRFGRLTIERPAPDSTHSVDLQGARPMLLDDLEQIMRQPESRQMDSDVIFSALSDQIEPVGPMPSLTAHTPIKTHLGDKFVKDIRRGDVVMTACGTLVPVLQVVRKTFPALGNFHPIRLRAGYFGLTRDIVVAPNQKIVVQGTDVEYMFGHEAVLLPARHLAGHFAALPAHGPELVTYYQLILPGHGTVMASGCPLMSLYIGRIRRKPDRLAASILASFDHSCLPEHPQPAWPVLKPYEAITLVSNRAA